MSVPLGYYLYAGIWRSNFHTVVPGQVYRSGKPSGNDLQSWRARYGIKDVIDLRADGITESYPDEERAAREAGMRLEYIHLTASHLPDGATLRKLIGMIETAPRPLLLHCEGGADRAGLASFLAAMAIGGQDYAHAEKQLSARYFHLDSDIRIAGVLRKYRQYCRRNDMDTGGWQQFRHWAFNVYP